MSPHRTLLAAALLLAGCDPSAGLGPIEAGLGPRLEVIVPAPSQVVLDDWSAALPAQRAVIRDAGLWKLRWDESVRFQHPPPPLPPVDFEADMVLLAALGGRPNGGYSVRVDSITVYRDGVVADVTERVPGPTCVTTAVISSPAHAVRIPKRDGVVRFRLVERTFACS